MKIVKFELPLSRELKDFVCPVGIVPIRINGEVNLLGASVFVLYGEVSSTLENESRKFRFFNTGEELPEIRSYIDSAWGLGEAWHLYETP